MSACVAILASAIGACVESHSAPASVRIVSARNDAGEIALVKGESMLLSLDARDEDGDPVDVAPQCVSWESSDPGAISAQTLAPSGAISAIAAWFDLEIDATDAGASSAEEDAGDAEMPAGQPYLREPEAIVTVDVCGTRGSVTARSVIDIAGTWQITVGKGLIQTVTLAQDGRNVVFRPADGIEVPVGSIRGDVIDVTLMGHDLHGRIIGPTEASGVVVGIPSPDGDWKAIKHAASTLTQP